MASTTEKKRIRGACPILNCLANDSLINYSGEGLGFWTSTREMSIMGIPQFAIQMILIGFFFISFFRFNMFNYSLQDLSVHGLIEHDNSIAREDFAKQPDQTVVSPEAVEEYVNLQKDGFIYLSDVKKLKLEKYKAKKNGSYFHDKFVPMVEYNGLFYACGTKIPGSSDQKISVADFESIFVKEKFPDDMISKWKERASRSLFRCCRSSSSSNKYTNPATVLPVTGAETV
jgi:hypothetical protein